MNLRESLPARVALATAGLLALVLLIVTSVTYTVTAMLLRGGLDRALMAALPATSGSVEELQEEARRFDGREHERRMQVLDPSGTVQFGPEHLPVDRRAVDMARVNGVAFISVTDDDGKWRPRTGPDWWQALTPSEHELRVMYAVVGRRDQQAVVQLAAPLGSVNDVLPALLRWLLGLVALGVLASSFIAWKMAAQSYKPLRAVTATAEDISTHTLSLRIPDVWHDRTLRKLIGVLNEMIARLQAAFEAQGRFVAAAAHELRSPVAAMRAEIEVTLRRERTPEEYKQALQGALEETARLTGLAEHLLILARYERGASLVVEHDLPVGPLLERAAGEVRRATGGEITVQAAPDLTLDGDPIALERLVTNLARNGIEAGGSPVTVNAEALGDDVVITVQDQGPGIPAEAIPQLFEPFYRADPARGRDGGTGLGLAIVKTVVDAHGGTIAVSSEPGKGARFEVRLPRQNS